jgi:leader peptidase (prepilin peptidase)/N-methyltransferase
MTGAAEFSVVLAAVAGLLGLLIGSFVNVVVYRVPAGMSIVAPPSACPNCGRHIRGFDNIPVLSWLLLRGRCRDCREPISWRYPAVELGTAILFLAVAWRFLPAALSGGASTLAISAPMLIAFAYLAVISLALALIDIDVHRLPNTIVLPAFIVAAVLISLEAVLTDNYGSLLRAGVGMVALFVLYFLLAFIYPGGMGFGDVKLAAVLGIYLGWLGWGELVVGAFSAFLLGGIFAIVLMIFRRAGRKTAIPFGPWMLLGAWIAILFGNSIATGYLALFGLS